MIKSRSLLFALLPTFLLFFISLGMVISEKACIEWYGFGIDSNNYVYIGTHSEIEVYDDQKLVRTIDIPHYRTYYFTLENDDTIILSDSVSVYKMDNLGNVVEKYPDKNCEKYNELQHQRVVLTSGGLRYKFNGLIWRYKVVDENDFVLYQMPIFDYSVKIALILSSATIVILAVVLGVIPKIHSQKK